MKRFSTLLLFLVFQLHAFSQQNLPAGLTPAEEQIMLSGSYRFGNSGRGVSTAPPFPVRTMAQWEEQQTLVITWTSYTSILAQIADAAQEEVQVLIHCTDSNAVKSYLTGQGVPLTNINYLEVPFNSIWIRDYGAHTVYKNDVDSVLLVEWIYNRPRPSDDVMPDAYAAYKGIGLYSTTQAPNDLVNTGGNWMVDGFGTALASKLILDENDAGNPYSVTVKSEADVDTIMKHFMGIDRYIKMETLPYDDIHHIDMHMKFLDEETILVGKFPDGVSDGPQIEANILYVTSTFNSVFGTPYKIVRIPMVPSTGGGYPGAPFGGAYYRTYANFVFVNKTVIVPTYRTEYDTTAIRILTESLPGYNIVTIDADNTNANLISAGGVIHCITNNIGVADPMLISHQNLPDTYDEVNPYLVDALIRHKSGISSATMYWSTTPGTGYTAVAMSSIGNDHWTASIPAHPAGTTLYYYVEGNSVSGKTQVRPIVAPQGYFHFKVLDIASSVEENSNVELMDVFPNPASAITCIPVQASAPFSGAVKMYDMLGNLVETIHTGSFPAGESRYFIHADQYAAGSYLIVVEKQTGERSVKKLMIR
ncbi:MAG: agmatine deiminase family protein [Flavobacteriales bacterium]|nr:agmatine deiminase family protein [Flavobacteriales bacterium]